MKYNFSILSTFVIWCAFYAGFIRALRTKRSLLNFNSMIRCVTGRSGLMGYNDYGCWCGSGGRGNPVDEIDSCCYLHDKCYAKTQADGHCSKLEKYLTPYEWRCNMTEISIGGYKLLWNSVKKTLVRNNSSMETEYETGYPECVEKGSTCGAALCQCDKQAVLCFAQYPYPASKPKCI